MRSAFDKRLASAIRIHNPVLNSPCIYAKGATNASGYVLVWAEPLGFDSPTSAHVVSWMLANGLTRKSQIPKDPRSHTGRKEVHHICAEYQTTKEGRYLCRSCINPDHLTLTTRLENISKRSHNRYCTAGLHLMYDCNGNRRRYCKECLNARLRERYSSDPEFRERRRVQQGQYRRQRRADERANCEG